MGVVIIAMEDVYFFNVRNKRRVVVDVPWHENWRKFKCRAWIALSIIENKKVNLLKKDFILEKQNTIKK